MKLFELYKEGPESTVNSNDKTYSVDDLIKQSKDNMIIKFNVDDLDWILKVTDVDESRVKEADLSAPILVYNDISQKNKQQLVVLDGAHRLTKAKRNNLETIKCKLLSDYQIKLAEID